MDTKKTLTTLMEALNDFAQEVREETVREIEARIRGGMETLAGTPPAPRRGRPPKAAQASVKAPAKPHKASPGRKLQGRYMGMLRRFKGRANQQIKKVARTEGIAAAIARMEKLNKGNGIAPKVTRKPKAVQAAPKAVAKATPKAAKGAVVGTVKKGSESVRLADAVANAAKEVAPAVENTQGA